MAMSKKAYFFSLAVLLLLAVMTLYLAARQAPGHTRHSMVYTQRLAEGQAFLESLQRDSSTALYVASYRSFLVLEQEVLYTQDSWAASFDDDFEELVISGTLAGSQHALITAHSVSTWLSNLEPITDQLQLDLRVNNLDVQAWQDDPWHVQVRMTGDLVLSDELTDAAWHVPLDARTNVSVELLNDPVYTKGAKQRYVQRITRSPYSATPPVDPAHYQEHLQNHYYVATRSGPSFLSRLKGPSSYSWSGPTTIDDPNGIESLVDADKLQEVSIQQSGSIIDWQYLVIPDAAAACRLQGVTSGWAIVPAGRASDYPCT